MNDSTRNRSPEALYREYQNTRDNIPSGTYKELMLKANDAKHEANIDSLLQEAKKSINSATTERTLEANTEGSIIDRLKGLFSNSPTRAWGTAFASLALAVVVVPFSINSSMLAHLEDCAECATYIANSSLVTRSALPTASQVDPSVKIAAKLGRLDSNIKIADFLDNNLIMSRSVEALKKINQSLASADIETALSSLPVKSAELLKAISATEQSIANRNIFTAAQSLQIANVTARFAKANKDSEQVARTLDDAVSAYTSIKERTVLQENLLLKLQEMQIAFRSSEKPELERIIDLYTQAMTALGA